jgi:hypothetical protein
MLPGRVVMFAVRRRAVGQLRTSSMNPTQLSELVNRSGFPLQIGIANLVHRTTNEHGWREIYREHSWKNPEGGTAGFLDLALENRHTTSVLVIECKRVLDASWVFLQPGDRIVRRSGAKAWVTSHPHTLKWFDWFDLRLDPVSAEAEYCVVPGQDANSRPLLERVGAEVVSATEALAQEEKWAQAQKVDSLRMYFSLVLTTARLQVCVFDPEKITLNDGKISDPQFEEVPYVRFRKQLSTRAPDVDDATRLPRGLATHEALARAKEHTVFVVNSEKLLSFLSEFSVQNESLRRLY